RCRRGRSTTRSNWGSAARGAESIGARSARATRFGARDGADELAEPSEHGVGSCACTLAVDAGGQLQRGPNASDGGAFGSFAEAGVADPGGRNQARGFGSGKRGEFFGGD